MKPLGGMKNHGRSKSLSDANVRNRETRRDSGMKKNDHMTANEETSSLADTATSDHLIHRRLGEDRDKIVDITNHAVLLDGNARAGSRAATLPYNDPTT